MRKKQTFSSNLQNYLNLDSLVDIVSNNVGILVILAVFMAVFSLIDKSEKVLSEEQSYKKTEKLKIPWSHATQKNSLLILLSDDRLLYLDRALVYKRLKNYLSDNEPLPKELNLDDYSIKLTTGGRHSHCIEFLPSPSAGQWWHNFSRHGGIMQTLMKKYPPEQNYFFFWVNTDSFDLFREIRKNLWKQNFEVGWKPIRKESAISYCSGDSQSGKINPQ
tara:strand:- start:531 stop:1187 length:657 start_codon:yes stop_codon:yes gene_type:complete